MRQPVRPEANPNTMSMKQRRVPTLVIHNPPGIETDKFNLPDLKKIEAAMQDFIEGKLGSKGLDFNILGQEKVFAFGVLLGIFSRLGILDTLGIKTARFLEFLVDVEKGYFENPYHNFFHATDVTYMVYYVLNDLNAKQHFTEVEIISIMLAALCHDIGHPGKNNLFQINSASALAKKYNNQSVLEAYSADLADGLIAKHGLLQSVGVPSTEKATFSADLASGAAAQSIKKILRQAILATDMSHHYSLVKEMADLVESEIFGDLILNEDDDSEEGSLKSLKDGKGNDNLGKIEGRDRITSFISEERKSRVNRHRRTVSCDSAKIENPTISRLLDSEDSFLSKSLNSSSASHIPSNQLSQNLMGTRRNELLPPQHRMTLLKVILHAADISNTIRPWQICKQWSDLVLREHFEQGDYEKSNSLPISPNMDREACQQSSLSLDFGDLIVRPFFDLFADILPGAQIFLEKLDANRGEWEKLRDVEISTALQSIKITVSQPHAKMHIPSPSISEPSSLSVSTSSTTSSRIRSLGSIQSTPPGSRSPSRRVSVAAGTLIIPDSLVLSIRRLPSSFSTVSMLEDIPQVGDSLTNSTNVSGPSKSPKHSGSPTSHLSNDGLVDEIETNYFNYIFRQQRFNPEVQRGRRFSVDAGGGRGGINARPDRNTRRRRSKRSSSLDIISGQEVNGNPEGDAEAEATAETPQDGNSSLSSSSALSSSLLSGSNSVKSRSSNLVVEMIKEEETPSRLTSTASPATIDSSKSLGQRTAPTTLLFNPQFSSSSASTSTAQRALPLKISKSLYAHSQDQQVKSRSLNFLDDLAASQSFDSQKIQSKGDSAENIQKTHVDGGFVQSAGTNTIPSSGKNEIISQIKYTTSPLASRPVSPEPDEQTMYVRRCNSPFELSASNSNSSLYSASQPNPDVPVTPAPTMYLSVTSTLNNYKIRKPAQSATQDYASVTEGISNAVNVPVKLIGTDDRTNFGIENTVKPGYSEKTMKESESEKRK